MAFAIRPARTEDIKQIIPWTSDTFSWGDYVPERLPVWLDDHNSTVLVATIEDEPVGLVHGLMLSSNEAWLEAARVQPDHRRTGLGNGSTWQASSGRRNGEPKL